MKPPKKSTRTRKLFLILTLVSLTGAGWSLSRDIRESHQVETKPSQGYSCALIVGAQARRSLDGEPFQMNFSTRGVKAVVDVSGTPTPVYGTLHVGHRQIPFREGEEFSINIPTRHRPCFIELQIP